MPVAKRRIDRTRQSPTARKATTTPTFASRRGDATESSSSGYVGSGRDEGDDSGSSAGERSVDGAGDQDKDSGGQYSTEESNSSEEKALLSKKRPTPTSPRRSAAKGVRSASHESIAKRPKGDDDAEGSLSEEEEHFSFQDDSEDEDYSEGQGSEDDDDSEDAVSESSTSAVPKPLPGRRRTALKTSKIDDDEEEEDSSSESSVAGRTAKAKAFKKRGRLKEVDADESSVSAESNSDIDFVSPARRKNKPNAKPSGQRKHRLKSSDSIDDPSPRRSVGKARGSSGVSSSSASPSMLYNDKVPAARRGSHKYLESSGDESVDRLQSRSHSKSRSGRKQQLLAQKRKGKLLDGSDREDSRGHKVAVAPTRRRRISRITPKRASVGRVRDDEIGDSEDSADSSDLKKRRVTQEGDLYRSDSSSSAAIERAADNLDSHRQSVHVCSSLSDAITEEALPTKHVCLCSPDGSSRQCFALETLRQVALTSSNPKTDANGRLAFLQPPHFRTVMSDDLLDQIASRFGRDALDVNGPFYNAPGGTEGDLLDPQSYDVYEEENFRTRLRRFATSVMGKRDLYVCPLCYTVACNRVINARTGKRETHRRRDAQQDITDVYSTDVQEDPMYVLGSLDDEEFEVAATFCFRTAKQVERHLEQDHHVTLTRTDSGLYARYMIRKQDGLVQRFVHAVKGKIQQYWFSGCNFEFVHLLQNVDKVEMHRLSAAGEMSADSNDSDSDDAILTKGEQFFRSFRHDSGALWTALSAPYSTRNDVGDFVVEDGASDNDDTEDARLAHLEFMRDGMDEEMEEDRKWVARLEEMEQRNGAAELDAEGSYEAESSSVKSLGVEDESSEDEWLAKKRKSMEARRSKGKDRASKRLVEQERGSSADPFTSDASNPENAGDRPVTKKSKVSKMKRESIQDSDDE